MKLEKRIATTLALIAQVVGDDEAAEVKKKVDKKREEYGKAISLSGLHGSAPKQGRDAQRVAVRAVLLAGLVLGKITATAVAAEKQELLRTPTDRLHRQLQHMFPSRPFRGQFANRMLWAPQHFTDPKNHDPSNYRYITHGIQAGASKVAEFATVGTHNGTVTQDEWNKLLATYRESAREIKSKEMKSKGVVISDLKQLWVKFARLYLQDLTIIKRNIVSTALISHDKHATYYPMGYILRVPPECVYSTAPADQAVKNRAQVQDTQGAWQSNAVNELERVFKQHSGGRIWTPDEILAQTSGVNGKTGYNEIVVVGRSPGGQEVEVIALFVKTHPNGNYYVDSSQGTAFVDLELEKLIKGCSATKGIPVVKIPDASSAASTFPCPF